MEKIVEFNSIKEFSKNEDVNATNANIKMHYDRCRKKYITTIENGKKT